MTPDMIRKAEEHDLDMLAELAILLWNSHTLEDLKNEFSDIIKNDNAAFFLILNDKEAIGFAQCQLRYDYVEGTKSSPAGYLKDIFVKKEYRKGCARILLQECKKWALEKNCKEFASDCEVHNDSSLKFHLNMGFTEANRVICFTKKL